MTFEQNPSFGQNTSCSSTTMPLLTMPVSPALRASLSALAHPESMALDALLIAAWGLLLSKYSGEDEVILGYPAAGTNGEQEAQPGYPAAGTAGTSPLRLRPEANRPLAEWLQEIDAQLRPYPPRRASSADGLPDRADGVQEPMRYASRVSIGNESRAEALYGQPPAPHDIASTAPLHNDPLPAPHGIASTAPLHLTLHTGASMSLTLRYDREAFSEDGARMLLERVQQLLANMVQDAGQRVGELSLLNAAETARAIHDWNATGLDIARDCSLYTLFAAQAAARNEATALVAGDLRLSYRQLADRAGQIAAGLSRVGVVRGDRVALSMEKTPELIAAMLGIIKLGAAYVPVGVDAPAERRAFILRDAQVNWTLTRRADRAHFAADDAHTLLFVDDYAEETQEEIAVNTRDGVDAHTPAYIIYTSGTTGTPKGVEITHRNLINFCAWCDSTGIFTAGEAITQFAPYTFDASAGEIFGTLTRGCELHLLSNALIHNPPDLMAYMVANAIRFSAFPPSYLRQLDPARVPQGMTILTAGSAPTAELIVQWSGRCRYINGYGPTETTIMSSAWMQGFEQGGDNRLSIGRPIANTRLYIVDSMGQLCPPGLTGEIWIGGEGVSPGYINRPALTAELFIADPWISGGKVYRTGDTGRWLDDGRIEFIGRRDHQIKLRGFRVEPGEIESQIAALATVSEAAVLALPAADGEMRLVAWVVPASADGEPPVARWREELATRLPDYMIPAAFVLMPALPLTANGKIDRKALPAPGENDRERQNYQAPGAGIESTLADLWQSLLGIRQVGRQDHFFRLGGHSLMAMQLSARLREQNLHTDVQTVFAYPVLADLAGRIRQQEAVPLGDALPPELITPSTTVITPDLLPLIDLTQRQIDLIVARTPGGVASIQDIYALTPLQEGILFHHLLNEQGDPYLQVGHLSFTRRDTLERYLAAIQRVIDRHDILRSAFIWEGLETPAQVVLRSARLHVTELSAVVDTPAVAQLRSLVDPLENRIDLSRPPLLHVAVAYDPTEARWEMLLSIHHLVDDIFSLQILLADIQVFLHGQGDALPPARQFRQQVAQRRLHDDARRQQLFFAQMLADIDEPTMPFDLQSGHADGQRLIEFSRALEAPLAARLRERARHLGVSVSSLCHLGWARVLAAASNRDSVVFGTLLSGRMQLADGELIMGPCINTLPLRLDLGGVDAVSAVHQTHARLTGLMDHEQTPLSLAQQASGIAAPTPLFSVLFNYRHNRPTETSVTGTLEQEGAIWHGFTEGTHYPLTLSVDDAGNGFTVNVQAVGALCPERIFGYYRQSLLSLAAALEDGVLAPPAAASWPVCGLNILPPEERQRLLETWNDTAAPFPTDATVHQLFERQAARQPQALALQMGACRISYDELNQRANRLAHYLISLGVTPDTRIAVCTGRSESMLVALLAVLKSGGAYVPLDPEYPPARLAWILEDAAPAVLMVDARGRELFATAQTTQTTSVRLVDLAQDGDRWAGLPVACPEVQTLNARHLAYVIYTSGSTGRPKGVMVEHRQVVNFLTAMQTLFTLTPADRLLAVTSISFDIAALELYLPLMTGAAVVLASREQGMDPWALHHLLTTADITLMQATPTTWRALLDTRAAPCPQLKILCGGEALPSDLATRLYAWGASLWNLYGPTETAIWSTCNRVKAEDVALFSQPIGHPIANTQVYLLDAHGEPVPAGAVGELYIGGEGVTRGYHQRPDLTAERFIPNPFATGASLYRTGDFAKFMPDGRLVYLGRADHQLKLRGHRIELGEIEARLLSYPGVRDAVVVTQPDTGGQPQLVAYTVPAQADGDRVPFSRLALRHWLQAALPDYMVPAAFVTLDALPLTPNGKTDRSALPLPDDNAFARRAYEPPQGAMETTLAAIWETLLGVEQVGRQDHFFELGGYSLLAVRLLEQLRQRGLSIEIRTLFDTPVLADLAARTVELTETRL